MKEIQVLGTVSGWKEAFQTLGGFESPVMCHQEPGEPWVRKMEKAKFLKTPSVALPNDDD